MKKTLNMIQRNWNKMLIKFLLT